MKRFAAIFFVVVLLLSHSMSYVPAAFAQSPTPFASISAIPASISSFPTLFPTSNPTPTPIKFNEFPIMQQFDDLAPVPTATPSPTATISADQLTPAYSSDYCLDVPVIMYHHIEPLDIARQLGHEALTVDSTIFENQVRYLVEHNYHTIALADLITALRNHGTLPEKSVVLTVDDGYIDNYSYGFMMAKKYHVILNFMIPTALIGQPDYMTWDHLKEMNESPYAKLYNHTTTHAPLGLINKQEIIKEVNTANQDFLNNLGIKNDIVVYPYGSYSDEAVDTLKSLGMIAALSTDPGRNECTSNIMKLPRVRVGNAPLSDYGY